MNTRHTCWLALTPVALAASIFVLPAIAGALGTGTDPAPPATSDGPPAMVAMFSGAHWQDADDDAPPPRRRPSREGRGDGSHDHADLSPDFIDECLEVAERIDPNLATRLRAMCHEDPAEFERIVRRSSRRIAGLVELKRSDPKLYEIKLNELVADAQVHDIAQELVAVIADVGTDSAEAVELRQRLYGLVQTRHALSIRARGAYILRLQKHLEALETQLDWDLSHRKEAIEREMAQVLQQHSPPVASVRAPATNASE